MGLLFKAVGGSITEVTPKAGQFSLKEIRALIGCRMVQAITLPNGSSIWFDEEGKFNENLITNQLATEEFSHALFAGDYLVGNLLQLGPAEVS